METVTIGLIVGYSGSVLLIISFIAQLLQIYRTKDVESIFLKKKRQDLYRSDENWTGGRPSVIVYYHDFGHYELVALKHEDGTYTTFFSPDHSLIQFLKSRK